MRDLGTRMRGWVVPGVLGATVMTAGAQPIDMEEIVVTAGRAEQASGAQPFSVAVFDDEAIATSPAGTTDEVLRALPGFSLFRRESSRTAHPTAQGATLRGIAPSGASRALVLLDGIPLNDPFGGWVYWSRVPKTLLSRVEVVRGGGSSVWGSGALSGVVQVFSLRPSGDDAALTAEGGNLSTWGVGGHVAHRFGETDVRLFADTRESDGFEVIREDQRGAIDRTADFESQQVSLRVDRKIGDTASVAVEGGAFREDRGRGTRLTRNETETGWGSLTYVRELSERADMEARFYGQTQTFSSTFSAQEPDRSSESPALDQFDVPSLVFGGGLQGSRRWGETHRTTVGYDGRWVDGETNEDFRFLEGAFANRRVAGGEEQLHGMYAEDVWSPVEPLSVTLGARVDLWQSRDGSRRERSLADGEVLRSEDFDTRTEVEVSPRLGLRWRAADGLALRAAGYRAVRFPTLNELFRPFRVRNDITEANADLEPETLLGAEVGADGAFGPLRVGVTGFWNEVEDSIGNVTLELGPGSIEPCGFVPGGGSCRQRRNVDRTRILGLELDGGLDLPAGFALRSSLLLEDAEVRDGGPAPEIEGKRIAQVPEVSAYGALDFDDTAIGRASLAVRYVGDQFEDDRNELRLADVVLVDLFLGRELTKNLDVFFAAENLFDEEIDAGKTADGLVTVGQPRILRGGIRWRH